MDATQGLLSMAFHPDYAANGRFFITYFDSSGQSHLTEYLVSSDPNVANPSSATPILAPVLQPSPIHNWNCVKFGPDGLLYLATGDGGGYHGLPPDSGSAQDLSNTEGKILRLDIDAPAPYIPSDNPFVGQPGVAEEIWVYGLREPWRFAFDALTGDVFIADVGQTTREELNFIPGGHPGGLNFGWACREGLTCTGITGCTCPSSTHEEPILEYPHGDGLCCVIGGEVYRGLAMPELHGTYFYADLCSGRIWSLRYDGTNMTEHQERSQELVTQNGTPITTVYSFGSDADGELYVLGNFPSAVFKIIPAETCGTTNYCATSPNSVGAGARISSTGSTSAASNDFQLLVDDLVPYQFTLCFYGSSAVQVPFNDGTRCVGGRIQRLNPAILASSAGHMSRSVDLQSQGQNPITPGSTWHFQAWYRDQNGPGGSGSNLSDALTGTFCP
jgi:glucose/arabinose dehydrogenase